MRKQTHWKVRLLFSGSKGKSCPRLQETEPQLASQQQAPTRMLLPTEDTLSISSRQQGHVSPSICSSPPRSFRTMKRYHLQIQRMAKSAVLSNLSKGESSETMFLRLTEFWDQPIITRHHVGFQPSISSDGWVPLLAPSFTTEDPPEPKEHSPVETLVGGHRRCSHRRRSRGWSCPSDPTSIPDLPWNKSSPTCQVVVVVQFVYFS